MQGDEARDITLDIGPLRLAARRWGPTDGHPVLALHGWLDNAATFDRLAPLLDGLCIVALDFAGHGHSDHRPPGRWYHLVDYAGDVLAAADALGWERFSLMGHSLGGVVSTLVAGARPDRIERLALIEALAPIAGEADKAASRLGQALARSDQQGRRPSPVYATLEEAIEARGAAGGLSAEATRFLVERGSVAHADGIRWRTDPRLRLPSPYRFTEQQVLSFLDAIAAPTLVIGADQGLLPLDAPLVQRGLAAISDLRVERLAGNHHLHLEEPAPVAECIAAFLPPPAGAHG